MIQLSGRQKFNPLKLKDMPLSPLSKGIPGSKINGVVPHGRLICSGITLMKLGAFFMRRAPFTSEQASL
jgi:hypothetical protein